MPKGPREHHVIDPIGRKDCTYITYYTALASICQIALDPVLVHLAAQAFSYTEGRLAFNREGPAIGKWESKSQMASAGGSYLTGRLRGNCIITRRGVIF